MKVYAVSSGTYSDYTVHELYESREDAEAIAKVFGYEVEEFDYYPAGSRPTIYKSYSARIYKHDTSTYRARAGQLDVRDFNVTEEPKHNAGEWDAMFYADGPDRERVVKSVTDRYAAWKAQQEGIA